MNDAHLHLVLNHFPIIIPIVALIVLIIGFGTQSAVIKRVALGLFVLGGILTFPAAFTGEGAEEVVEELAGVSHTLIHEHEEKAETFILASYILGAISLLGLWANYKGKKIAGVVTIVVLLLSVVVVILGKGAGTSGGEIRHEEIRQGVAVPAYDGD